MIDIKVLATGSSGNCYRVSDGETSILLECGISFKKIQEGLNYNLLDIEGCLVTHEHKDHTTGLDKLLKAGIRCYMSKGTKEAIGIEHHRIKIAVNKRTFRIGTWTIMPFDTQHDVAEPFGYLLKSDNGGKLLFATDTYFIKYRFKDLTHIMVECNYDLQTLRRNVANGRVHKFLADRVVKSHFGLENVIDFFRANDLSNVEEIWLLHLSDTNSDESLIRKEIAKVTGKLIHIP